MHGHRPRAGRSDGEHRSGSQETRDDADTDLGRTTPEGQILMTAPAAPAPSSTSRSLVVNALLPALIATLALFAVAFDQGQITAVVASGADELLVHELFHDARHMLGFPCH